MKIKKWNAALATEADTHLQAYAWESSTVKELRSLLASASQEIKRLQGGLMNHANSNKGV